jgi:hypothetical protein
MILIYLIRVLFMQGKDGTAIDWINTTEALWYTMADAAFIQ